VTPTSGELGRLINPSIVNNTTGDQQISSTAVRVADHLL
jgi:hypothetical protein